MMLGLSAGPQLLTFGLSVLIVAGVVAGSGALREAEQAGESGQPETVLECVQGICTERVVTDPEAPLVPVSAEEEIERLGRTPPTFDEISQAAGADFRHRRDQDFFNLGGGAAAADYNNDGWLDIYATNSFGPNALFENRGDGTFKDVAAAAGVADWEGHGHGAAWGDYNNDGAVDLYVTNWGNSRLFENQGDGTFVDVTGVAGVADASEDYRTTGAVWGDYDGDGWMDLLVVRHVITKHPLFIVSSTAQVVLQRECRTEEFLENPTIPRGVVILDPHDMRTGARNFTEVVRPLDLFHNNGDGTFEAVTELLGDSNVFPSIVTGAGFKPAFFDYDSDGDFDIYVVNDFGDENVPNVLWRNDGPDGEGGWLFTDVSEESGANARLYGMGLAAGDYDNDGDIDINMTDIGTSVFYENRAGQFVDVTDRTGTARGLIPENGEVNRSVSWGTVFADFDNDGWLDLYTAAGYLDSDPCSAHPNQPNSLFMNMGDGTFVDVSKSSGADDPGTSREVVAGDFDGDGLIDIFVVNMGSLQGDYGDASLFRNTYESDNAWLEVAPMDPEGNVLSIGAKVTITANGYRTLQYAGMPQGHTSQSLVPVHFGLGEAATVDEVLIEWQSGTVERFEDVPVNQLIRVSEPR